MDYIKTIRNSLLHQHWINAGRISNMIILCFGSKYDNQEDPPYSIHIECGMRIILNKRIAVVSEEIYQPNPDLKGKELDHFDWDQPGTARYDFLMNSFFQKHKYSEVVELSISEHGDMLLQFDADFTIEIYINSTDSEDEEWCFIGDDDHPVISRSPYEFMILSDYKDDI